MIRSADYHAAGMLKGFEDRAGSRNSRRAPLGPFEVGAKVVATSFPSTSLESIVVAADMALHTCEDGAYS